MDIEIDSQIHKASQVRGHVRPIANFLLFMMAAFRILSQEVKPQTGTKGYSGVGVRMSRVPLTKKMHDNLKPEHGRTSLDGNT